ncbi:unnamed protein product, partial [Heterotrigona itama]
MASHEKRRKIASITVCGMKFHSRYERWRHCTRTCSEIAVFVKTLKQYSFTCRRFRIWNEIKVTSFHVCVSVYIVIKFFDREERQRRQRTIRCDDTTRRYVTNEYAALERQIYAGSIVRRSCREIV